MNRDGGRDGERDRSPAAAGRARQPGPEPAPPHEAQGAGEEARQGDPRGASRVMELAEQLAAITTRPWTLMEVCGGQTHAIVRWGLDQLLPAGMRLVHGPGCPVCVTPARTIERALQLASRPEVILCSYGDMLRVPGAGRQDLLGVRAAGGDVRLLTTPLQALTLARQHPQRQVVFLAVGFETTAPATALLAEQALALGVSNLSLLCAHVRVPPAMEEILADPESAVQGFLAAGHVCAVQGTGELQQLVARRRVPVVVTGFAPEELLQGILRCVGLLEAGRPALANAYGQVVRAEGNPAARALLRRVFRVVDRPWRGFGVIRAGGLALADPYAALDAERRFGWGPEDGPCGAGMAAPWPAAEAATEMAREERSGHAPAQGRSPQGMVPPPASQPPMGFPPAPLPGARPPAASSPAIPTAMAADADQAPRPRAREDPAPGYPPRSMGGEAAEESGTRCIAGAILRGRACPTDCPAFAGECSPEHPLGAPMVSSEGACAAWYRYRR